ncbi:MAG TPA: hypothetical protein VNJ08_00490 [Bacteriovoracaceae bacterium]|nr:hypothetical protein [Bacteriovoracaceae bacterium]
MRKRRSIEVFSISFLDLISGALGAVIILYVAIPKNQQPVRVKPDTMKIELSKKLRDAQEELSGIKKELAAAKLQLLTAPVIPPKDLEPQYEAGFRFKGKKIVFIVDTSFSMKEDNRIGQVKAGLKMLLTSLPGNHAFDIIQYPLGERAPFKSLWGEIRETSSINKTEAIDFIYSIEPLGGTPTRDALLYVLNNYPDISDIVILSDGSPTLHNSNRKDDIFDILKIIRLINGKKIQINSIGVGTDFTKDKTSDQYRFLSLLSSENSGFFVGF